MKLFTRKLSCLVVVCLSVASQKINASSKSNRLKCDATVSQARVSDSSLGRRKLRGPLPSAVDKKIPVLFLDADSTLRVSRMGRLVADTIEDTVLIPSSVEYIKEKMAQGYLVAIVSNQGGVGQYRSLEDTDATLSFLAQELTSRGAIVNYFDFAEASDQYRKPQIGMARNLEMLIRENYGPDYEIDKSRSLMVGDAAYKRDEVDPRTGNFGDSFSNSDRLFAENLGIGFSHPADAFGWRHLGFDKIEDYDTLTKFEEKLKSQGL